MGRCSANGEDDMTNVIKIGSRETAPAVETVKREIATWAGISLDPGPLAGGVEIRFRHRTLGHLHVPLGGVAAADLIFSPEIGNMLIAEGRAHPHPMVPGLGWVSVQLGDAAEIANAIALFRKNYERMGGALRAI